jgi:hypothetical protein
MDPQSNLCDELNKQGNPVFLGHEAALSGDFFGTNGPQLAPAVVTLLHSPPDAHPEESPDIASSCRDLHKKIREKFELLRVSVQERDIKIWERFSPAECTQFVNVLQGYRLSEFDAGFKGAFKVQTGEKTLEIGLLLLKPLVIQGFLKDDGLVERFTFIFVLHEMMHHIFQGLYSRNFMGIGRADVVLEDLDYVADAFSILVGVALSKRIHPETRYRVYEVARHFIETAIVGMEAFDRSEQGSTIRILSERRLRRYLIWNIQFGLCRLGDDEKKLCQLLMPRLSVQIAPISSQLNERSVEKVVILPANISDKTVLKEFIEKERNAELFVSIQAGAKLFRLSGNQYAGSAIITAHVACFEWNLVREKLENCVEDILIFLSSRPEYATE